MKPKNVGDKLYHVSAKGKLFTATVKAFKDNGEAVVTVNDSPNLWTENRWHLFQNTKAKAWKDFAACIKSNLKDAEKDVQRAKKTVDYFKSKLSMALRESRRKENK